MSGDMLDSHLSTKFVVNLLDGFQENVVTHNTDLDDCTHSQLSRAKK